MPPCNQGARKSKWLVVVGIVWHENASNGNRLNFEIFDTFDTFWRKTHFNFKHSIRDNWFLASKWEHKSSNSVHLELELVVFLFPLVLVVSLGDALPETDTSKRYFHQCGCPYLILSTRLLAGYLSKPPPLVHKQSYLLVRSCAQFKFSVWLVSARLLFWHGLNKLGCYKQSLSVGDLNWDNGSETRTV